MAAKVSSQGSTFDDRQQLRGVRNSIASYPGGAWDASWLQDLLVQALEAETGGVQVYEAAIRCAIDKKLRSEWEKYLEETQNHERILGEVFQRGGVDPEADTPGRRAVRNVSATLVDCMESALEDGDVESAQLIAAECVVLAETKDHFNWEMIGQISRHVEGDLGEALREAYALVEDQEDEHLYHTKGWARELWYGALGLPSELPPLEEKKDVRTAIGAARVRSQRKRTINRSKASASKAPRGTKSKGSRTKNR